MLPLTQKMIRDSFVNASRKEVVDLTLPADFAQLEWTKLDYLGWRDLKKPKRAYVMVPIDGGVAGILLRQADAVPRQRAQCSWCQDTSLPNSVVFYSARRAGDAGRKGDSVGTLICEDFQCSVNVRKLPPMAFLGFDREAARGDRVDALQAHAVGFLEAVIRGS